jgi:5-methylcytosine-specific restriction protein A
MQAPVFRRRAAPVARKAWAPARKPKHERIRGRAGMKLRAQIRQEEPFCRHCLQRDLKVATEAVDHIIRLADGGSNDRSNLQGLCTPCHDAKSAAEQAADRAAGRRETRW